MSEFECNHGELVGATGGCGRPNCRIVKMDGMDREQCSMQRDHERYQDNDDCEEEGEE